MVMQPKGRNKFDLSPRRQYVCKKGLHKYKLSKQELDEQTVKLESVETGQTVMELTGICAFCHTQWLKDNFELMEDISIV